MAIKFNSKTGKIRLWKSSDSASGVGIGINFGKDGSKEERDRIYKAVEVLLSLKYGDGSV